jgi:hypothetical protein
MLFRRRHEPCPQPAALSARIDREQPQVRPLAARFDVNATGQAVAVFADVLTRIKCAHKMKT